jgi:hypothetical protein
MFEPLYTMKRRTPRAYRSFVTTICMPDHIERERKIGWDCSRLRDEAADNDVKELFVQMKDTSLILPVAAMALDPDFFSAPRPTESEGLWIAHMGMECVKAVGQLFV